VFATSSVARRAAVCWAIAAAGFLCRQLNIAFPVSYFTELATVAAAWFTFQLLTMGVVHRKVSRLLNSRMPVVCGLETAGPNYYPQLQMLPPPPPAWDATRWSPPTGPVS
jgi:hypothetical protein